MSYLLIVISAVLINNFVLMQFLGICPFLGVSRRLETALGMGLAVIFVMALAGAVTYGIQQVLVPDYVYLQTLAFILTIAALVQVVEMVMQKVSPVLYQALGIFLPLITTNCAVLGVTLLNIKREYNFMESVVFSVAAAIGFTLALLLFAGIRERMERTGLPKYVEGPAIGLISAGLLSMAFMAFSAFRTEKMLNDIALLLGLG
jgi:electron transport complex protein RnfA